MENTAKASFQPWLSIWYKPRGTIRAIVDSNPRYGVILLAVLSGIARVLDNAAERSLGDDYSMLGILIIAFLGGSLGGILSIYLMGALLRWTGSWLGGEANTEEVRAAVAWASIPDLLILGEFVPIIALFGRNWFLSPTNWLTPWAAVATLVVLAPSGLIILFFRAFLSIKCLAEVHRFSFWKGLLTFIISFLVLLIPLFLILFWTKLWNA